MLNRDKHSLSGILDAINKIEVYVKPFSMAEELYKSELNFDAVLMNFLIIGEMVDRLSEEIKSADNDIDWLNIKGFRNIIAHDYLGIDADEVWEIITVHLKILKPQIEKLLSKMGGTC